MNGKEQTLYVKYLFPFKYQHSATEFSKFFKVSNCLLWLGIFRRQHFISSSPHVVYRIRVLVSMLELFVELPLSVPVLPISELLDTSPRNISAARMNWTVRLIMLGPVLRPQVPGWKMLKALSNLTTQLSTSALALLLPRKSNQLPGSGSLIPSRFSY